jgi:glycosyltransferase involved in cell wall biosynthesis
MGLLEAMAIGISLIAPSVDGVPKVIQNGINGILVNSADSKALAEKIVRGMCNPSLFKEMVEEAMNIIRKEYDINERCRKIKMQYNLVLHKKS